MRRVLPLVLGALLMGATAATAFAQGKDWDDIPLPPHGHVLLINADFSGGKLTFDKCVEFAAGEALPTRAHHDSVHTGRAGGSPLAEVPGALLVRAGHVVAPLAPLTPWDGCEDLTSGMSVG